VHDSQNERERGKMMKKLLGMVLAGAMALSMVACGTPESSKSADAVKETEVTTKAAETTADSTASDEKVKLSIYHIWAGGDSKAGVMTEILDAFQEKYPNVELDIQTDTYDAYSNKIKTFAASDSVPDVTTMFGFSALENIAKTGTLMDITEFATTDQEIKDTLNDGALGAATYDGKVYYLPAEVTVEGMFYNKALFDKYNLTIPTNFDELKKCIEVFKSNGIIPISLAGKESFPSLHLGQYFLERTKGSSALSKIAAGEEKFENPDFMNGLTMYKELVDMGAFPENIGSVSYDMSRQYFVTGKAAMINDGSWNIAQYDSKDDPEFGKNIVFTPFPAFTANANGVQDSVAGTVGAGLALSSKLEGARKEAALNLIKFICVGEGANKFLDQKFLMPVKKSGDPALLGNLFPQVAKAVSEHPNFVQYDNLLSGAIGPKLNEAMQELVVGGDPATILKKMDEVTAKELGK
jgi:raffinose/stachyose/melibiose transport system substrate-binding protein